ncbi:hypothetical protein PR003_g25417 [Phytophthora rubi]|uniref:Uncharacterized protein n=1 Tax=Phytophthora rubi TaxID=129364 RepID=A0A6A4CPC0_9STRA|nr:hypothetical protein PR003_g25417 [Phytophthora rubi]
MIARNFTLSSISPVAMRLRPLSNRPRIMELSTNYVQVSDRSCGLILLGVLLGVLLGETFDTSLPQKKGLSSTAMEANTRCHTQASAVPTRRNLRHLAAAKEGVVEHSHGSEHALPYPGVGSADSASALGDQIPLCTSRDTHQSTSCHKASLLLAKIPPTFIQCPGVGYATKAGDGTWHLYVAADPLRVGHSWRWGETPTISAWSSASQLNRAPL